MRFFHVEVQIFRKTHRKYLAAFNGKYQGIHWKISKISRGIQWRISRQSLEHIENIKAFNGKYKGFNGKYKGNLMDFQSKGGAAPPPLPYFHFPLDSLHIFY